ncbi:trypsin-like peptidase domain-containing protein [Bradyrhizobium sp. RDT46]|uniref:trypsin-like peptidase domain-containing protein n=1 Tax=Bradyrhizobium sp. RDT46 TaxID=3341829 RepID=UPI0035C78372
MAVATGFFWLSDRDFYLITNWHNVTGWDQLQGKSLSGSGAQPTYIEMPLLLRADGQAGHQTMAVRKRYNIPLYADGKPIFEHPKHGSHIDVIAIKVALMDESLISKPINALDTFVDFEPQAGDDVFVLGYPGGLDGGHELAIWKRGSIASQPQIDIDGLPKLLIDTATRQGMSGAPVVARRTGITVPRGVKASPEVLSGQEIIGQSDTFLGVYSGRIGDDPMGLQLGIVWKAAVVDEIIRGGRAGRSPFE